MAAALALACLCPAVMLAMRPAPKATLAPGDRGATALADIGPRVAVVDPAVAAAAPAIVEREAAAVPPPPEVASSPPEPILRVDPAPGAESAPPIVPLPPKRPNLAQPTPTPTRHDAHAAKRKPNLLRQVAASFQGIVKRLQSGRYKISALNSPYAVHD